LHQAFITCLGNESASATSVSNVADFGVCHFNAFRQAIILVCLRLHICAGFGRADRSQQLSQQVGYPSINLSTERR
jgi:hypothetical protein